MTSNSNGEESPGFRFTAPIEVGGSYPFFLTVPGSGEYFGTRAAVKVSGTVDGHPFDATLMPSGGGPHWLPLRASLRKLLASENPGTEVSVHLTARR